MKNPPLGFLLLAALTVARMSAVDTSPLVVTDLRCEYATDPVGVDEPAPRLSWRLESGSAERGLVQTGARILVASSSALLEKNHGDLWDVRLPGAATAQIAYAGKTLVPHTQVFWKVQVVDGAKRRSAWSATARWSMGLLQTGAWRAEWIGLDGVKPSGAAWLPPAQKDRTYVPVTQLRKDFSLATAPARAVLYVTALGNVEPRLNGRRVADEYFTPGWTDYAKRLYYRAYDVTALLKPGANTLGALLADGWFRGNIGGFGQNRYGRNTRMRAELHIFDATGKAEVIRTDSTWKASTGPILEADQQAGESYDARLEQPGWDAPGFADQDWAPVATGSEVAPAILRAHPAPPVRRVGERPTVAVMEPKPGVYVFDLGQNFAGFARLKVKEPAGTIVTLRSAEMLNADGTVYLENLRTARVVDTYVCKGGEETWEPRFTFHGFRYVEVAGLTKPPPAATITGVVLSTGNADTGAFESSSALLNQIWANTRWGQLSNYLEVPTDCPQRDERLGWTGDAQVFLRTGAYNQDIAAFMTKWMVDVVDTQTAEGAFNDTAPIGFKGSAAGWADVGIILPWTLWRVYGDTRILERHYDAMCRYLEFCRSQTRDFIGPNRGYGDWLAIGGVTEKHLISTAYLAYGAKLMAEIAGALGKADDETAFHRLFGEVSTAFQKKFINADGSIGEHRSQTAHLLALRFGLLTPEQRAAAIPHLVRHLEERNWRHGVGFLGVNLLLPTLTDIGRTDGAYFTATGTEFPSWGYSIAQGATTIWERWNSYTKANGFGDAGMNSFNHYAYGSCVEWLYRTVLGIDAIEPGFARVVIKPEPGPGVNAARGHYDSLRGRIATRWKLADGRFTLDVSVPPNVMAEIHVPADAADTVTEGGLPATSAAGLKYLRFDRGAAVYSAGSGDYRFAAPYAGPVVAVAPPVPGRSNAAEEEIGPKLSTDAGGGARYTLNTKIGVLLDDPAAKAALLAVIPEEINHPDFAQARESTFRQLYDFAPDYFTAHRLQEIAAALAKVGRPKWSVETTLIGELLANPATRAVLAKHAPEATNNPDFSQAASMTLRKVAEFAADYFTAERLKAIEADLTTLEEAAPVTPPAPAPAAPDAPVGLDAKIGALLDNPATKAVLARHLGAMIEAPQFSMARGITLKQLQPHAKDVLTGEKLKQIGDELAETSATAAAFGVDTKIGALLDHPAAKAVLAKHLPKLLASPQIAEARDITLRGLQQYFPAELTTGKLAAINADLAAANLLAAASTDTWSVDTLIGQLMDNAGTLAVLMKHLPEVFGNAQIAAARQMPLRKLQSHVPAMADSMLAQIDRELRGVPVPAGTMVRAQPIAIADPLKLVTIPLWAQGAPGSLGDRAVDQPSLTVVAPEPEQRHGTAIIVAPGGAYQGLAANHEGRQVADWFAAHGVTAFVLKYRLISSGYHHPAQLNDGERAVRWVRAHAKEYGIDPNRVGMIGFSAGGHLTTMVATQGDDGDPAAADPVDRQSSRLNFMVLAYPGVLRSASLTSALLGQNPDPASADLVNTEKYLTKDTPPTYIFHTADDETVSIERVREFHAALQKAGVPAELNVYPRGPHGMGLALHDPALREWPARLEHWLDRRGLLGARAR